MNPGEIICQMPKWDFATAGYILSSLPQEVRCELSGRQHSLIQMLLYLCGVQCRRSGRQSLYALPGQEFLGQHIGRSTRTVRRYLDALSCLGLISYHQRSPLSNKPQTNIYKLGGQLLALLHNIKWPKTLMKSQADKSGRQRPKEKVRQRARSSSADLEGYRDSHKPADLSSLPVPGEDKRLDREKMKAGFAQIYAKLRGKVG